MTRRITQATAFLLALQVLPVAASIAGPYVMLVNHGLGWRQGGQFDELRGCETAAAEYAMAHKAQTGCTTARAFERWQGEVRFQRVAQVCAAASGAQIVLKPGQKVDVRGAQQARFDFAGCMAATGRAAEDRQ